MACWLAMQDDGDEVEYKLAALYRFKKGEIEVELRRFLADMEDLLKDWDSWINENVW